MGMKSPSFPPSAEADVVLLTEEPLDASSAAACVEDAEHGAVVVFEGRVRGTENGTPIAAIAYEAYAPMAEGSLSAIVREAREERGVRLAIHHRLGRVPVNEASLIVAAGAGHRAEAFDACRWAVDAVKARAAVWKISFEPLP